MITRQEIAQKFPNVSPILEKFLLEELANQGDVNVSQLIYFLDSQGLYLGITTDPDGMDWYVDMNAIPLERLGSRQDAEIFGVIEGFNILEGIYKESKIEL